MTMKGWKGWQKNSWQGWGFWEQIVIIARRAVNMPSKFIRYFSRR